MTDRWLPGSIAFSYSPPAFVRKNDCICGNTLVYGWCSRKDSQDLFSPGKCGCFSLIEEGILVLCLSAGNTTMTSVKHQNPASELQICVLATAHQRFLLRFRMSKAFVLISDKTVCFSNEIN